MSVRILLLLVVLFTGMATVRAQPPLEGTSITAHADLPFAEGFVARGESVATLLQTLGNSLERSPIISAKARKKQLSGSFDLSEPRKLLERISGELGLIWYDDGQSLYVYDASESRNTVGQLRSASLDNLADFLRKAGLADPRYPVRGGAEGTFYLSAPPVYVDIVVHAAEYIDSLYRDVDQAAERIEVIPLRNSFVYGRTLDTRGSATRVPGVAEVINNLLATSPSPVAAPSSIPASPVGEPPAGISGAPQTPASDLPASPSRGAVVMAYPETNSLVVRGTFAQVELVKRLVAQLDVARRQIELSLWIVDLRKDDLDKLGVSWGGTANLGSRFGIGFNQPASLNGQEGARFLAAVKALSSEGQAAVVSRPVVLTQENVPAVFDNNNTFYARTVGERTSSLNDITYGTLVSVVPRIDADSNIEMQLRIEDGTATRGPGADVDGLPLVGRTRIETVARVPLSFSLLVGGYTRREDGHANSRVPGASRLPLVGRFFRSRERISTEMARVFLIQPRLIASSDPLDSARSSEVWAPPVGRSVVDEVDAIRRGGGGVRE
ncbi:type III secretion system outer membrane ring subunit SctC [Pinirhizobacter sp.]|jgi:type III secretion protein C|uniref:type III secretion system outer membrane ring subunit SctC n=1 Tax=Pinirhizobacter sp. TaxID=2950432 RepID=UPI002F42616A